MKLNFLLLVLLIENVFSINKEIIVILGCSINQIQKERVQVGLEYVKRSKTPNLLFLTGGVKENIIKSSSEASMMLNQIDENINLIYLNML